MTKIVGARSFAALISFPGTLGAAAVLLVLSHSGCVPSAPVSPPASTVPVAPANGTNGQGFSLDGVEAANAGVRVYRKAGTSEYQVEGSYGLKGSITRTAPESPEWVFSGSFNFATSGFTVGEPWIGALGAEVSNVEDALLDFQGTIIINIPVTLPPADAVLEEQPREVPVHLTVRSANPYTFVVILATG